MVPRIRLALTALALTPLVALSLHAQGPQRDNKPSETGAMPPKTWVDKDTGHRVWRVSDEPNSGAFYFNVNAFTPDHKSMVYNSPDGIRVLDLATMTTRMLVPNSPPPAAAAGDAASRRSRRPRLRRRGPRHRRRPQDQQHLLHTHGSGDPQPMQSTRPTPIPARFAS